MFDSTAAAALRKLAAGDGEKPAQGRDVVSVPVTAHERVRESLGGEVRGQLRVARAHEEEGEHDVAVTAVELSERVGVATAGSGDQGAVAQLRHRRLRRREITVSDTALRV